MSFVDEPCLSCGGVDGGGLASGDFKLPVSLVKDYFTSARTGGWSLVGVESQSCPLSSSPSSPSTGMEGSKEWGLNEEFREECIEVTGHGSSSSWSWPLDSTSPMEAEC